ncbi:hypothetical protein [Candidatus Magnetaquiglobus chichijimensis]|uniref:hypothetical protein n=1 Tax=Candidatus Magnetaquiglobus chichijimensis TaxID=3141448 RepID=UPI003B973231
MGESGTDHQLEEEIGVEVQNMLHAEMNGKVSVVERELTEDEKQLFSEAFLSSSLEQMIPSVGQERRLMGVPKAAKRAKTNKRAKTDKRAKSASRPARRGKGSDKKGKGAGSKGKKSRTNARAKGKGRSGKR